MRAAFLIAGIACLPLVMACGSGGVAFSANGGSTGSGGGKTTTSSGSGATGGTSSGTGGSTTSSSSSTSGGTQMCPMAEPIAGAACPGATVMPCQYKPYPCCQDDVATCDSGKWTVTQGTCPAPTCPASAPATGDACGTCPQATVCLYTAACSSANGMEQFAFCMSGQWKVSSGKCQQPMPVQCGATTCPAGDVCVRVGTSTDVGCKPAPCPMGVLDCSCAHSVCPPEHPMCLGTDGPFVNCQ